MLLLMMAVMTMLHRTECLHGHQEQGSGALPTIFPQPVVLASSFDEALAGEVRLCG
jgi:hypothetical protein